VNESRIVATGGALGAGEEWEKSSAVALRVRSDRVLMRDLGAIVADGAILEV
jgi:hypothetical protein